MGAWKRALCGVLVAATVASVVVRMRREVDEVVVSARRGKTQGCEWSGTRAAAGSVVSDVVCRVNASALDAGVCVELAFRRVLGGPRLSTRCLPSLAVIGAMKCGTTNLMLYLSLHPGLRTTENAAGWPVESRFFSRATDPRRAAARWREYVAKFPPRRGNELTFDKSPNYVVNPLVPLVLRRLAPSIKLVATVRDPTRRAYSHFQHDCRNGRLVRRAGRVQRDPAARSPLPYPCAPDDFHNMVRADVADHRHQTPCDWSYGAGRGDAGVVARGFYACQLDRWLRSFPRDRLLVLVFERFVASRTDTLAAVAALEAFVGLPPFDYDASLKVALVERLYAAMPSRQGAYLPMRPDTARTLDDLYCHPNRRLLALLPDLAHPEPPPWACLANASAKRRRTASSS